MLKQLLTLAFFLSLIGLSSCNNDLDVTADYKEIGLGYMLLNHSDSVHVVRIQKAFLGDGNALTMAQVPDSTYYPDILDVRLERYLNGNYVETIQFSRTIGPDKDPGLFPVSPNILYVSNGEQLDKNSDYKLIVTNTQSGYEFWAETPIVDTVKIIRPSLTNNSDINWVLKLNNNYVYNEVPVEFYQTEDCYLYNLIIRFRFNDITLGGTVIPNYIDWNFGNQFVQNPSNSSTIEYKVGGESFYKTVAQKLNPDPSLQRREAVSLDFIVTAGSKVLSDYVSINSASTSILQSIPLYTNFNNGLGIMASRFTTISGNKGIGSFSIDSLVNGVYTKDLGFQ